MSVAVFPFNSETMPAPGNTTATVQVPFPFHSSGKLCIGDFSATTDLHAAAGLSGCWLPAIIVNHWQCQSSHLHGFH
jgi:hypothetical protein